MDESPPPNRLAIAFLIGTFLGLAVAGTAWCWLIVAKPADAWPLERAVELKAARDAVHAARGEGRPVVDDVGNLKRAVAHVDQLELELEDARNYRHRWTARVAGVGLALTMACGLGYLAVRGS